jgi:osmotically-inducible protein OsmY
MEAFGNGKYIVYLLSSENDTDAMSEIKAHLSKQLGVPAENIQFKSRDGAGNYIFET